MHCGWDVQQQRHWRLTRGVVERGEVEDSTRRQPDRRHPDRPAFGVVCGGRLRDSGAGVLRGSRLIHQLVRNPGPVGRNLEWLEGIRARVAVRSAATVNYLAGVSCTAATACTAVGSYTNSSASQVTLVEVWNGSEWRIKGSPNPVPNTVFTSVSCTSPTACTAGGYAQKKLIPALYDTVAESWNGTKWRISSPPATMNDNVFLGMVCISADACVAVGSSGNGGTVVTLAEISTGSGWSTQTTPNPGGGAFAMPELSAISCRSATVCMAVGRTQNGSTLSTLAELYS